MMIEVAFVLYLIVGLFLVAFGPLRMLIQEEHTKAAISGAIMQARGGAKRGRLFAPLLTGTMAIVAVVIWPVGLSHLRKQKRDMKRRRRQRLAEREAAKHRPPPPLRFTSMGGVGSVVCRTCRFEQIVVSFTHGEDTCNTGYQCSECGRFVELRDETKDIPGIPCECGGSLHRDRDLFCPKCRGTALDYHLAFLT